MVCYARESVAKKIDARQVMSSSRQRLTVVLFCSGNGADVKSYRPKRDESQWWNRRDALVRCVSSFLFCRAIDGPRHELILFYDGDHSCVHMEMVDNHSEQEDQKMGITKHTKVSVSKAAEIFIPTEQSIIALWKEAVGKALEQNNSSSKEKKSSPIVVCHGRLACWANLSSSPQKFLARAKQSNMPDTAVSSRHAGSSAPPPTKSMTQDWSKRELLEYLQKECSMEFLREHGLNSAPNVILRKANRSALAQVFQIWLQEQQPKQKGKTSAIKEKSGGKQNQDPHDHHQQQQERKLLEEIFQTILRPPAENDNRPRTQRIAATLHESSNCELPCFGDILDADTSLEHENGDNNNNQQQPLHLCLFLGAVRDMLPIEYQALENACKSTAEVNETIPLVKVRLGSVPEFTSKILSVVSFHSAHGRLFSAMQQLVRTNNDLMASETRPQKNTDSNETTTGTMSKIRTPPQLHILCLVPLRSNEITIDLDRRNRSIWCLVRVLVTSLWRSKFASSQATSPLENQLTLVFLDGKYTSLRQREWVSSLAEQHQAAPSEYQVLNALVDRINQQTKKDGPAKSVNWDHMATEILNFIASTTQESRDTSTRTVISLEQDAPADLTNHFYGEATTAAARSGDFASRNPLVFFPISSSTRIGVNSRDGCESDEALRILQQAFLRAFDRDPLLWRVYHQSIVASSSLDRDEKSMHKIECEDWEASSITVLQHFMYQDRLFCDAIGEEAGVDSGEKSPQGSNNERESGEKSHKKKRRKEKKVKKEKKRKKRKYSG